MRLGHEGHGCDRRLGLVIQNQAQSYRAEDGDEPEVVERSRAVTSSGREVGWSPFVVAWAEAPAGRRKGQRTTSIGWGVTPLRPSVVCKYPAECDLPVAQAASCMASREAVAGREPADTRRGLVSGQLVAQLAQRPVDPPLDRREGFSLQPGDLGHSHVGAEAQRDRLSLLVAEAREGAVEVALLLDRLGCRDVGVAGSVALERPGSLPRDGARGRAGCSARSCRARSSRCRGAGRTAAVLASRARRCRRPGPRPAPGRPSGRPGTRTAPARGRHTGARIPLRPSSVLNLLQSGIRPVVRIRR